MPIGELVIIRVECNCHVGKEEDGYHNTHATVGFGQKNQIGEVIIDL